MELYYLIYIIFTVVSFPIIGVILYGLLQGMKDKQKWAFLVSICFLIGVGVLLTRYTSFILHSRLLIPLIPLLGLPICYAFSKFKSSPKKLFIGIIAIGLLVRLFTLIIFPDAGLTDSMYHLNITQYVIANGALPLGSPPPLYYFLTALPFILLPIPLTLETARVFPFIFSALTLLLSYILFKKIFPKHWMYGLAFVVIHPLLIIFGATNYTSTLAALTVLLCFYIYWSYVKTKQNLLLVVMPFALALLFLTRENAALFAPPFFLAFLYEIGWKK